jgi:hypothetical protein
LAVDLALIGAVETAVPEFSTGFPQSGCRCKEDGRDLPGESSIIATDKGGRSPSNVDDEDAAGCSTATDSSRRPRPL